MFYLFGVCRSLTNIHGNDTFPETIAYHSQAYGNSNSNWQCFGNLISIELFQTAVAYKTRAFYC